MLRLTGLNGPKRPWALKASPFEHRQLGANEAKARAHNPERGLEPLESVQHLLKPSALLPVPRALPTLAMTLVADPEVDLIVVVVALAPDLEVDLKVEEAPGNDLQATVVALELDLEVVVQVAAMDLANAQRLETVPEAEAEAEAGLQATTCLETPGLLSLWTFDEDEGSDVLEVFDVSDTEAHLELEPDALDGEGLIWVRADDEFISLLRGLESTATNHSAPLGAGARVNVIGDQLNLAEDGWSIELWLVPRGAKTGTIFSLTTNYNGDLTGLFSGFVLSRFGTEWEYLIGLGDGGEIRTQFSSPPLDGEFDIQVETQTHLVFTFTKFASDLTMSRFFVNGVLADETNHTEAVFWEDDPVLTVMGGPGGDGVDTARGVILSTAVYIQPLSPEIVAAHQAAGPYMSRVGALGECVSLGGVTDAVSAFLALILDNILIAAIAAAVIVSAVGFAFAYRTNARSQAVVKFQADFEALLGHNAPRSRVSQSRKLNAAGGLRAEVTRAPVAGTGTLSQSGNTNKILHFHYALTSSATVVAGVGAAVAGPRDEPVVANLVQVFELNGNPGFLLRVIVNEHISGVDDESELFRSTSFVAHLLAAYAKMIGGDYVRSVLAAPISAIMDKAGNRTSVFRELDDTKASPEEVAVATAELTLATNAILDNLLSSTSSMPVQLRAVCALIRTRVNSRFPAGDAGDRAVAGFVLLRFISPAIVSPQKWGMAKGLPGVNTQRSLILITKMLQALASNTALGTKEPFMQQVEEYRQKYRSKMSKFLSAVSDPRGFSRPGKYTVVVDPEDGAQALIDLYESVSAVRYDAEDKFEWPPGNAEDDVEAKARIAWSTAFADPVGGGERRAEPRKGSAASAAMLKSSFLASNPNGTSAAERQGSPSKTRRPSSKGRRKGSNSAHRRKGSNGSGGKKGSGRKGSRPGKAPTDLQQQEGGESPNRSPGLLAAAALADETKSGITAISLDPAGPGNGVETESNLVSLEGAYDSGVTALIGSAPSAEPPQLAGKGKKGGRPKRM